MSVGEVRQLYVLVGDIGGTNSLLELFAEHDGEMRGVKEILLPSAAFASFDLLLDRFFAESGVASTSVAAACFSVAGPAEGVGFAVTNPDRSIGGAASRAGFKNCGVGLWE